MNRAFPLLFILIFSHILSADPEIRNFFPSTPAFLGKPVFWNIRLIYPMWQEYSLRTHAPAGLKMEVAERRVSQEAGQMSVLYRIAMTPQDVEIGGVPSLEFVDQKGQAVVLNGKPLKINLISGSSLQLKQPEAAHFSPPASNDASRLLPFFFMLLIAVLLISRWRSRTPKAKLLRGLKKAQVEMKRGHFPFALWKMLRSDLIWGFRAEPYTASQLKEQADGRQSFVQIAEMLEAIEQMRYSGQKEMRTLPAFEKPVQTAIEVVKKRKLWRR